MPRSNSSVDSPKKTKQKKLTEEEVLVLNSHLEEWKEAAAADRKKILKAVIKEARAHAPTMDDRLLKKRKYVYRDWLYNQRPEKTQKKKASKLGQKWTSQSVIGQLCEEEIINKTRAMPGLKKFIERYQTTLTTVMASLSKEQLEEAQNIVIKWSSKAPPAGVQADFAKKKAPGMMKDLATKLWKQASMRIFILSAWKTEEGEVRINGIDFNAKLEGNSFTDTKDWKPMLSEWNAYAGEDFILIGLRAIPEVDLNDDDDDDEDNEVELKKSRKKGGKKDNYSLEVDAYRLPVIPDVEDLNLESKKHLIWTFLTKHYTIFRVVQPTTKGVCSLVLSEEGLGFVPAGVKMDNPSKIRLVDTDQLLERWHKRQKDHVRPTFEFKAWEGDDNTMRELVEMISSDDSETRPRVQQKKSTGKPSRRVEQESRSDDEDKDEEEVEEDKEVDKEDGEGKEDKEDGEGKEDNVPSPPSKSQPTKIHRQASPVSSDSEQEVPRPLVKKSMPVPLPSSKSNPTKTHCRASPVPSEQEEDPRPPVKKPMLVPKPTKKWGRVDPIRSDSVPEYQPPVKKSKPTARGKGQAEDNTGAGSVQSTSNNLDDHLTLQPASQSPAFGPASGVQTRKKTNKKTPLPKPTTPSPGKGTGKKTKGPEAQITKPVPKRPARTAKASYKAHYMQK
ncbi:hypothetical protein BDR07DRAFT_1386120 [Suillus spraguei]|nr:hypothetical protein BDR07DRAFT_1386120 [Suillus spraguei]